MRLLARTWNLFHGNAVPPERRAFLREMIELATGDEPDVVCLQELPVWAVARLEGWSGMQATASSRPMSHQIITRLRSQRSISAPTGRQNSR